MLAEIVEIARSEDVDLSVVAGDLFDAAHPPPAAEALIYGTLLDLAEVAPVVVVAGNHDHPGRLRAVAPLLSLGRVTVGSTVARPEDGGVVRPVAAVRVALLPFLSQRAIVTAADLMELDSDQHGGKFAGRMAALVETLAEGSTSDEVNLVVGHVMVHGGSPGGGERDAHTVLDYSVPAQIFPPHLSYVALGHLHRHQRMPAAVPVWYAGSPLQLDFGETDDAKGVMVVEVEPGLPARADFRRLSAGRRLRNLWGNLEQLAAAAADLAPDDYIRVVVDEPARAGLADEVRGIVPQAVDVTLDPRRRAEFRPHRPSRAGRSHRQLFGEYLDERDARDERVTALFDELWEEVHEA